MFAWNFVPFTHPFSRLLIRFSAATYLTKANKKNKRTKKNKDTYNGRQTISETILVSLRAVHVGRTANANYNLKRALLEHL